MNRKCSKYSTQKRWNINYVSLLNYAEYYQYFLFLLQFIHFGYHLCAHDHIDKREEYKRKYFLKTYKSSLFTKKHTSKPQNPQEYQKDWRILNLQRYAIGMKLSTTYRSTTILKKYNKCKQLSTKWKIKNLKFNTSERFSACLDTCINRKHGPALYNRSP